MNYAFRLKAAASKAARALHADYGHYMRDGLADFLWDGFADADPPHLIAAKALVALSDDVDGQLVAATAVFFLTDCCRSLGPTELDPCAKELQEIVARGGNEEQYLQWARNWF
ncbi:MAG TPA: hypothetical protein VHV55_16360 [Pirellulales bacterium]|jgi:hypothetical protein|nr:hypothetical protein [Pirellulales bacterium]